MRIQTANMKKTEYTVNDALYLWAEKNPEKTFLVEKQKTFSFSETKSIAESLAAFFIEQNIPTGAYVCLLLPRRSELIFSFLGACLAKLIPAPVNYLEPVDNIQAICTSLQPAVIILDEQVVSQETLAFLRTTKSLVITTASPDMASSLLGWQACLKNKKMPCFPQTSPHELAYLNYTTGSSGTPKGALCTHANLYWNTRSAVEVFQLNENDVHLCMFAPFSHPHEFFCRALYTGATLVLQTEISPRSIITTINTHGVTCMMGLAVIYKVMARHCPSATLPSLRIAECGGMFTDPQTHELFLSTFHLPILSVWGSTETTGIAIANTPDHYRTDGSMGKPCPHYRVKIVTEEGTMARSGEIGELYFAGPGVVSGYNGTPVFPGDDTWYASGDLARKDDNGFYYFIDRISGMIKVAGLKVYPLQVEIALLQHKKINEVAVIGVLDKRRGCVPKAFFVTHNNTRPTDEELIHFCRQKMASYMIPKMFQQVKELPKFPSGKIDKKKLNNWKDDS